MYVGQKNSTRLKEVLQKWDDSMCFWIVLLEWKCYISFPFS